MDRGPALAVTLVVGALVAFQPPANAQLARLVGDLGAAFTSLLFSTAIVGVLLSVGLLLERMVEPAPPAGFLEKASEYEAAATIPRLLYLRTRKHSIATTS